MHEGPGKQAGRRRILGDEQHAAGLGVQPVGQAQLLVTLLAAQHADQAVLQHLVHRVHGDPRRLVHGEPAPAATEHRGSRPPATSRREACTRSDTSPPGSHGVAGRALTPQDSVTRSRIARWIRVRERPGIRSCRNWSSRLPPSRLPTRKRVAGSLTPPPPAAAISAPATSVGWPPASPALPAPTSPSTPTHEAVSMRTSPSGSRAMKTWKRSGRSA